jgi:hypothetical protein
LNDYENSEKIHPHFSQNYSFHQWTSDPLLAAAFLAYLFKDGMVLVGLHGQIVGVEEFDSV